MRVRPSPPAKRAFPALSRTTKAERVEMLKRLNATVAARVPDLTQAMALDMGLSDLYPVRYSPRCFKLSDHGEGSGDY